MERLPQEKFSFKERSCCSDLSQCEAIRQVPEEGIKDLHSHLLHICTTLRSVQRKIPLLSCFNVFFFQTVCAQAELMIPTRSACLPAQFWNTSSVVIIFFHGRNFSCLFMVPDYWSNFVMQYLNPSIRTGVSTWRSTENSTLWNSPYFWLWKE